MAGLSEKLRGIKREVARKYIVSLEGMAHLQREAEEAWKNLDAYPALADEEVFLEAAKYLHLQKQFYKERSKWALDKTEREYFETMAGNYALFLDADSLIGLAQNLLDLAQANVTYLRSKKNVAHLATTWRTVGKAVARLGVERGWFEQSLVK